jgi:hypothetical protein
MKSPKQVFCITIGDVGIRLVQHYHPLLRSLPTFSVTYGNTTEADLTRKEAADELGRCIMHALTVTRSITIA